MAPIDARTLTSKDGIAIYAECVGYRSKPHVLLAHGLACDATAFDKLFLDEEFQRHLFMVRYDLRGYGRSGKPTAIEDYASARQAEDVEAIVEAFGLKNFFFAGWSMGAQIAADIIANITPNPLAGLIYLGGIPYKGCLVGPDTTMTLAVAMLQPDGETALSSRIAFVDAFSTSAPYEVKNAWIGSAARQSPAVGALTVIREQDSAPLLQAGRKGLPLLVINGTEDKLIYGQMVVDLMKPDFPRLEVKMLDGIGHALCWEAPKEVGGAIVEFARNVRGL